MTLSGSILMLFIASSCIYFWCFDSGIFFHLALNYITPETSPDTSGDRRRTASEYSGIWSSAVCDTVGFCTDPAYCSSCWISLLTVLMRHVEPSSHTHIAHLLQLKWFGVGSLHVLKKGEKRHDEKRSHHCVLLRSRLTFSCVTSASFNCHSSHFTLFLALLFSLCFRVTRAFVKYSFKWPLIFLVSDYYSFWAVLALDHILPR